ncbi:MAG: hypothetical protein ABJG78_08545 [Cyclobacteriaceae bacterium]
MKPKKNFFFLVIFIVGFSSCTETCSPIPGAAPFLTSGQVMLLGEIHGTKEGPAFVERIACNTLGKNLRVTIGLELPQSDQPHLDEYLNSNGSIEARRAFLSLNFWSRDYQDGRASQSIFQLIESVRSARENGERVDIVLLDDEESSNRDLAMANRLLEDIKSYPNNFFVALTGNLHNIISEGSGRMGNYVMNRLGKNKVTSLKQSYPGGSAWLCQAGGDCGPVILSGQGEGRIGIFIDNAMGNYHGTVQVDSIHASLPARELVKPTLNL